MGAAVVEEVVGSAVGDEEVVGAAEVVVEEVKMGSGVVDDLSVSLCVYVCLLVSAHVPSAVTFLCTSESILRHPSRHFHVHVSAHVPFTFAFSSPFMSRSRKRPFRVHASTYPAVAFTPLSRLKGLLASYCLQFGNYQKCSTRRLFDQSEDYCLHCF